MSEKNHYHLVSLLWIFIFCLPFLFIDGKIQSSHSVPKEPISPEELKNFLTEMMAHNSSFRDCPAPSFPLLDEDCKLTTCNKDSDCSSRNQSCCFNGCIFTCVDKIAPPPVIDWDNEPETPPLRKEGEAVLRCTTSPRPAPSEPVGCPKGYVCKIEDHGDALERRYNSGICVPEASQNVHSDNDDDQLKEKTSKQTVYLPGGCVLSEIQFKSMQDFMTRSYVKDCQCVEGSVECRVSA